MLLIVYVCIEEYTCCRKGNNVLSMCVIECNYNIKIDITFHYFDSCQYQIKMYDWVPKTLFFASGIKALLVNNQLGDKHISLENNFFF